MNNPVFLLVSDTTKSFTSLHQYDKRKNLFQGEYSIIHNRFSYDHMFLSKFLLSTEGKPLTLISSLSPEYTTIFSKYERFLEDDISKYVGEQVEREKYVRTNQEVDKGLGQLQMMILKGLVEARLEQVQEKSAKEGADSRKLLGRELELDWILEKINEIIDKGNPNA